MVGRARKITGPYADASGKRMIDGGGTLLLSGNAKWAGPGGESVLLQKSGDIIVYHAYDARTGQPSLQISTVPGRRFPSIRNKSSAMPIGNAVMRC